MSSQTQFAFLILVSGAVAVNRVTGLDPSRAQCESTVLPGSKAGADALFGAAVALDGDVIVVGAKDAAVKRGAAYVYRFNGSRWIREGVLKPSDPVYAHEFGISVGVSGDTAMIGASGDRDNGAGAGAVYVFRFDGKNWVEQHWSGRRILL